MTDEEIMTGLKEILATIKPNLDQALITPQSKLFTDLGLDSLTVLLLSMAIETRFGFKFDGALRFETVADVIEFIKKQIA